MVALSAITDSSKPFTTTASVCRIMPLMATKPGFAIRCGTPDCEWGFPMSDLAPEKLDACYRAFFRHCVEVHGVSVDAPNIDVHLDLQSWVLTLVR